MPHRCVQRSSRPNCIGAVRQRRSGPTTVRVRCQATMTAMPSAASVISSTSGARPQLHRVRCRRLREPGRNADRGSRWSEQRPGAEPDSRDGIARALRFWGDRDHSVRGFTIDSQLLSKRVSLDRARRRVRAREQVSSTARSTTAAHGPAPCSSTVAGKNQQHRVVFALERTRQPRCDGGHRFALSDRIGDDSTQAIQRETSTRSP